MSKATVTAKPKAKPAPKVKTPKPGTKPAPKTPKKSPKKAAFVPTPKPELNLDLTPRSESLPDYIKRLTRVYSDNFMDLQISLEGTEVRVRKVRA